MKNLFAAIALAAIAFFTTGALADGVPLSTAIVQDSTLNATESKLLADMRSHHRTKAATVVSLNAAAVNSGLLTLTLPDGKTLQFSGAMTVGKGEKVAATSFWQGTSPDGSTLNLLLNGKTISGGIHLADDRRFRVLPLGDRFHVLVEMTPIDMKDDVLDKSPPPPLPPADTGAKTTGMMRALGAGDPTIHIMYVFTSTAAAYLGGNPAAISEADFTTATLQSSFGRSGVLLNVATTGYVFGSADDWTGSLAHQLSVGMQSPLVLSTRDNTAADIVIIVAAATDFSDYYDGLVAQINATPATAFAIVDAGAFDTSNGDLTALHEFGHLLGARHALSGTTNNDTTSTPWQYQHGYAVVWHVAGYADVCFHTIMSAPSTGYPVGFCPYPQYDEWALQWSNPSVYWRNQLTGNGLAANAIVLNSTGPTAAGFHTTKLWSSKTAAIVSVIVALLNN